MNNVSHCSVQGVNLLWGCQGPLGGAWLCSSSKKSLSTRYVFLHFSTKSRHPSEIHGCDKCQTNFISLASTLSDIYQAGQRQEISLARKAYNTAYNTQRVLCDFLKEKAVGAVTAKHYDKGDGEQSFNHCAS